MQKKTKGKAQTNSNLPRICANCAKWSWKTGCPNDRNAAPSKTCRFFKMGKYASYAIDNRGKVAKVDPQTYSAKNSAPEEKPALDWVAAELNKLDLAFVDDRDKETGEGCLWIAGGNTAIMQSLTQQLAGKGAEFVFVEKSNAVNGRPAWRLSGFPEQK